MGASVEEPLRKKIGGIIRQFILDIRPLLLVAFWHMVFVDGFLILVNELGLLTDPSQWIRGLDDAGSYMYIVL